MKICTFIILAILTASCHSGVNKGLENRQVYRNHNNDSIVLIQTNDSTMQTIFYNSKGDVFDTTMKIVSNFGIRLHGDSLPFLKFHWGGLDRFGDSLMICEYSNMTYLAQFIQLDSMYERPFFRSR